MQLLYSGWECLHDVVPEWRHSRNAQRIARMGLDVLAAELELFASGLAHNDIKPEFFILQRSITSKRKPRELAKSACTRSNTASPRIFI